MSASGVARARERLQLSARQRRLCQMLCDGYEQREMAKALRLALQTVKCEFRAMYRRHGITAGVKRVQLAVRFYRESNGEF